MRPDNKELTIEERIAFERGADDGEMGNTQCPYCHPIFREAWKRGFASTFSPPREED